MNKGIITYLNTTHTDSKERGISKTQGEKLLRETNSSTLFQLVIIKSKHFWNRYRWKI